MNATTDEIARSVKDARVRSIVVGAVAPTAIALIATVFMFSWLPELPDPIAVHWSGSGPDGFGPALPFILAPLGITLVFSVFVALWCWRPAASGGPTWNQKFLAATSLWLATMLSISFATSVAGQRGLTDAHNAPDVGIWMGIGAVAGLALAVAGWFLLPPASKIDETGTSPRAVDIQGQERVSWSRSARLGNGALVLIFTALAIAMGSVIAAVRVASGPSDFAIGIMVLVALLAVTNTWWRVTADHRGLIAKGAFGWPVKYIPLDRIRSVQVVDVSPGRDFGGWGWRWSGNGRSGIILRAGEAIEVTQASGKRFVITVDDAATGAGVLAVLIAPHPS